MATIGTISGILDTRRVNNFLYFTSSIYPTVTADTFSVISPSINSGELRDLIVNYTNNTPDSFAIGTPVIGNGTLS